ncbi:MAG: helix-turn-helix transcriptional regulator [Clostridia bacterium]|nr:helix-turn-helix transcriptional regulator [Clostridia bacterium]
MKKDKSIEYFCANVKFLRLKEKLSRKEMATKLRISVNSLAKIESGNLPPRLNAEILRFISVEFKIPLSSIFSSDFQMNYTLRKHHSLSKTGEAP